MKRMIDESGQTLVMVALGLTCILGFVGFATDVGVLLHAKRNLQIAADAAAIAGAKVYGFNPTASAIVAGGAAASAKNGITDGSGGATVVINPTPVYGPNKNKAGYVEAIVTQTQPTFFMRLFSFTSMPVTARAVALSGAIVSTPCVLALNPSANDTINLQGKFKVSVPSCQVIDDSNSPSALDFTGNAGSLTASGVGVVGGVAGFSGDSDPPPIKIQAPVSDPYAGVTPLKPADYNPCNPAPDPKKTTNWGPATAGGTICYSGTVNVGKADVHLDPGTYVFTGLLDFSGNGSLKGSGVTLYIAPGGTFGKNGAGNTTLDLSAPSTGKFAGILLYQDPTNTNTATLNGTPVISFTGDVYIPNAQFAIGGNTDMTLNSHLIVGQLFDFGSAQITINSPPTSAGPPPFHTVALVE